MLKTINASISKHAVHTKFHKKVHTQGVLKKVILKKKRLGKDHNETPQKIDLRNFIKTPGTEKVKSLQIK